MADYNNRVFYPDEVDKIKKEEALKRRQIKAANASNPIFYPDEFEDSQTTEAPEEQSLKEKLPEVEQSNEEALQVEPTETNRASDSNAIVFPDDSKTLKPTSESTVEG